MEVVSNIMTEMKELRDENRKVAEENKKLEEALRIGKPVLVQDTRELPPLSSPKAHDLSYILHKRVKKTGRS